LSPRGRKVFGETTEEKLLDDAVLEKFSLGERPEKQKKNSHLSLLAIVDCWSKLDINPYHHIICATPVFEGYVPVIVQKSYSRKLFPIRFFAL